MVLPTGWWSICGERLLHLLHRVSEGEDPDMVYAEDVARARVRRLEPVLLRVEDATANRCMFVVRWNHLLHDGTCGTSNVIRYVGRRGLIDGNNSPSGVGVVSRCAVFGRPCPIPTSKPSSGLVPGCSGARCLRRATRRLCAVAGRSTTCCGALRSSRARRPALG